MRKYIVILKLYGNSELIEKFYNLMRHTYQHSLRLLSGAMIVATRHDSLQIGNTIDGFSIEINDELKQRTIPIEDDGVSEEWIEPLKIQELFISELGKEHRGWLDPEKQAALEYLIKQ